MNVTLAQLQTIEPSSPTRFADWVAPLNAAMVEFSITTENRIEMFLAQIMHESAGLSAMTENLNYSAQGLANTWARYSSTGVKGGAPNALALRLNRQPTAIANNVYANRLGNGDEASGDGYKYRGHGPIMVTGRENIETCFKALGLDAQSDPVLLTEPIEASRSAAYFWKSHGLNEIADSGNFSRTTAIVNGGDIGGQARIGLWNLTQRVIA